MAPASADFLGQDGRVVKASFFCERAMVTRGFETRLQVLSSKVLWYVALVQSRPRFYMAPASADFVRMVARVVQGGGLKIHYLLQDAWVRNPHHA